MNGKVNNSKMMGITAAITGGLTCFCVNIFLTGLFFQKYNGTPKGAIINGLGVLLIIIITSILSLLVMLIIKKKNENR